MNRKQKACLLAGIAAVVVMGLFPPWVIESRELNRWGDRCEFKYTTEPGPYSWIGDPPARDKFSRFLYSTRTWIDYPPARARFVDLYRLGLQYFVVAVVTAGLIIIFGKKKGGEY